MIPPCDQAVLNANPLFKALHQDLTTDILNADGSTRAVDVEQSKREREVQDELKHRQVQAAKKKILTRVIGQIAYDAGNGLPNKIRDLVVIIALYLQRSQSTTSRSAASNDMSSLLKQDIDAFRSNLPTLAPAISNILVSELAHLRGLANETGTSSQRHREGESVGARENARRTMPKQQQQRRSNIAATSATAAADNANIEVSLSAHLSDRICAVRDAQTCKIPAAHREVGDTAALVLAAQTLVMERTIHLLERNKHGALERAERARAEHLAKVAEGVDGKVKIMRRDLLASIYTPETTAALARYRDHLRDTRLRLEEKQQNALRELAIYEGGSTAGTGRRATASSGRGKYGMGSMAEIAKKYGALLEDVDAVRLEIEGLGESS